MEPNGYTNDVTMTANLPVSLVRTGPIKIAFDHKVQEYINSVSVPEDNASSSDEEVRVSKRKSKKHYKSSKKSKKKSYSSDDDSEDEASDRFSGFLQMLELMFAVPTFDAAGTLISL